MSLVAEVAELAPRGVVCLLSAHSSRGLGTQNPRHVWLALPHEAKPPTSAPVGLAGGHGRMTDLAASVRARLLGYARAQRLELQSVLARYGVERLVVRIAGSPHADQFVLKGAQLLLVHAADVHRPARDIDLLGWAVPRRRSGGTRWRPSSPRSSRS